MTIYNDLITKKSPGNILESFSMLKEQDIGKVKQTYPNLPSDYLSFLNEIGFGEIGDNLFMIYSGLTKADEIFDKESAKELEHIALFGDDFSGYSYGYNTNANWCIVEIDSVDLEVNRVADSFQQFIREKINSIDTY